MNAFAAAVAARADGIETDVRVSRDGIAILVHDRVLQGCALGELTRREIESLLGHPVPTLDEALMRFPDLLWNVEVKTMAAVDATIETLRSRGGTPLLITSFRHDAVAAIARRIDADCGLLVADRPLALGALIGPAEPFPRLRTVVWDFEILDRALVEEARGYGWRNFAYGMETAEEHRLCAELGLDGIITDHIERGLKGR
jgi:glycerophosphoryl diester phosphodiesterase